jgi:hypothetical protein
MKKNSVVSGIAAKISDVLRIMLSNQVFSGI